MSDQTLTTDQQALVHVAADMSVVSVTLATDDYRRHLESLARWAQQTLTDLDAGREVFPTSFAQTAVQVDLAAARVSVLAQTAAQLRTVTTAAPAV